MRNDEVKSLMEEQVQLLNEIRDQNKEILSLLKKEKSERKQLFSSSESSNGKSLKEEIEEDFNSAKRVIKMLNTKPWSSF